MAKIPGVNVIAPVVPFDTADVHPSHEARYGRGGYRTVATLAERDAIPAPRREAGMLVFVTANGSTWRLSADLTTWDQSHVAADISDFTSAVIAAAPPTTNASLLTSGTISADRIPSTIARTSDVTAAVAAVVNAAPAALDTLNELAAALGNDASFATTVTNALAGKAAAAHTHVIADVTGLQTALDGKQASGSYAAAVHTHGISDVTGLQTALDGKAASSHTHTASAITDFTAAVVAAAPPTVDASLLTQGTLSASRLPSTSVTPGSYGSASSVATYTVDGTGRLTAAGTATIAIAAGAVSGLAAIATSGSASDLGSGTVATARLGSGTADSTTFLRGDGTWAAAGSSSASDLTTGTLANARLTTRIRASANLYLWSSFR